MASQIATFENTKNEIAKGTNNISVLGSIYQTRLIEYEQYTNTLSMDYNSVLHE